MYFVGIDISKFKHDCAIIDELCDTVMPSWSFSTYNKTISKGVVLLILLSSKIGYTAGVATCGIIRSSTVDLYLYSYSKTVLR